MTRIILSVLLPCLLLVHVNLQAQAPHSQLLHDLQVLSAPDMEGRRTGSEGAAKARAYLTSRFRELQLEPVLAQYQQSFEVTFAQDTLEGINLLGRIAGKQAKTIVLSAHYDHLGKRGDDIYLGADDNASGVAVLLLLADWFREHKPNYTLIFAAFDAEEMGLRGAKAFMEDLPLPQEQIVLNINFDMLSQSNARELYICGTRHYEQLKRLVTRFPEQPGLSLLMGHDDPALKKEDWTYSSDHAVFHKSGIPFLYLGVEDHEHYHQPSDSFEQVDQEFYKAVGEAIKQLLIMLDQEYR